LRIVLEDLFITLITTQNTFKWCLPHWATYVTIYHMTHMTTWKSVHGASYGLHKKYRFDESSIYMEKDQPKVRQKLKPCFWYCDTVHMSWKMCQGNKVKDTSVKTMFLLLFWYLHVYKADNIFQWCLPCLQCKRFNVEQHLTLSPVSYGGPSFASIVNLQQFGKIRFLQILAKTRVFANQGGLVRGQVEGFGDRCTLHIAQSTWKPAGYAASLFCSCAFPHSRAAAI